MTVSISTQVVNMLRSQLSRLEEIKKERETLEGEIKAVTFDMSVSFLTALAQDGAINEEQLSSAQLDQLYGAYNQRVQASLRAQEELLGQVQVREGSGTMCFIRHYSAIFIYKSQTGKNQVNVSRSRACDMYLPSVVNLLLSDLPPGV